MSSFTDNEATDFASAASSVFTRTLAARIEVLDDLSIYNDCAAQASEFPVLQCVANALEQGQINNAQDANTWFLIFASALIFFMQAGFAMLCAGSVRIKNVGNTMLKNLLDACGAAVGFFTIGYAFAFGGQDSTTATTFIGTTNFFMVGITNQAFWLFQFAFAATSATITAGTLAERCQMAAYLCYSVILTGFVYPVVAHSIWSNNGFLSAFNVNPFLGIGVIDFAGSAVVHMTGGSTAVFATMILGPRKGRFYDARGNPLPKPKPFPGHSVALQMLGTFILWFGWYGFNPGSALILTTTLNTGPVAALAAVNTTISAAVAGTTALFTNLFVEERTTGEAKFDLLSLMNGCLGGLVAITAGCAVVEPWAAFVIGLIAGWLYLLSSAALIRIRLDDAVDAIPVHLVCGTWGILAVGFLAAPDRILAAYGTDEHVGWFYELARGSFNASLLGCQIIAIFFVIGWVFFIMFPFFIWLNYMGWFRADSLEELVGLDISYHGGGAGGNDEVKLEYVEAFNRRKDNKQNAHSNAQQQEMPQHYADSYSPQEEAAMEAMGEDDERGGGMMPNGMVG
mmetsp:Transcript_25419/g.42258  ORF Transcript_25419/g.42258 Transcript_25419/m.42258 type:complete len:569 (+) Transcript_25419:95-1801(+)